MDNSTTENVISSTITLSSLSPTTKEILNDAKEGHSSDAGTTAGVTIAVLVLVGAIVAGIVLFIKRRNRGNVGPLGKGGKNDIEKRNPARTTWHEMETTSNRSSGSSAVVEYTLETADDQLEMQPSTMFPGTSISMYDNDSFDEDTNPLDVQPNESCDQTNTEGGNTSDSEANSVADGPTSKPRDNGGVSSRSNKAGDRTTVILDENTKAFKIKVDESEMNENETTKTSKESSQNQRQISDGSANADKNGNTEEEFETAKQLQNGYELAKVIPDNVSEKQQSKVIIIISPSENSAGPDESDNPSQDTNYVNVQINNGGVYVNQATLELESSYEHKEEANPLTNKDTAPPKPPQLGQYRDKSDENSNPNKAPIPQPRRAKRLRMTSEVNHSIEDIGQSASEKVKERSASENVIDDGASKNVCERGEFEIVQDPGTSDNASDRDACVEGEGLAVSENLNEEDDIDKKSNDSQAVHGEIDDEYVEYDPYVSDPDYDTADPIYDVPRSSKQVEIGEK